MSRWRPAIRHSEVDRGFTLIELTIAASLMGLIAVLVSTTVIGGIRTAAFSERRTDDASKAQLALLSLNADIRAADDISVATPQILSMTTRSSLGAGGLPDSPPETVSYELVGTDVRMTRQPFGGTSTTRVVLTGVSTTAGRPLFRYLAKQDLQRQCTTGPTVGTLGATVATPAARNTVYAIDVWMDVNSAPQVSRRPLVLSGGSVVASRVVDFGSVDLLTAGSMGIGQGCT